MEFLLNTKGDCAMKLSEAQTIIQEYQMVEKQQQERFDTLKDIANDAKAIATSIKELLVKVREHCPEDEADLQLMITDCFKPDESDPRVAMQKLCESGKITYDRNNDPAYDYVEEQDIEPEVMLEVEQEIAVRKVTIEEYPSFVVDLVEQFNRNLLDVEGFYGAYSQACYDVFGQDVTPIFETDSDAFSAEYEVWMEQNQEQDAAIFFTTYSGDLSNTNIVNTYVYDMQGKLVVGTNYSSFIEQDEPEVDAAKLKSEIESWMFAKHHSTVKRVANQFFDLEPGKSLTEIRKVIYDRMETASIEDLENLVDIINSPRFTK